VSDLENAARAFADTWLELLLSLPDDYTCHMACAEANAAARLYREAGRPGDAEAIIAVHAEHDMEGDDHWQGAPS